MSIEIPKKVPKLIFAPRIFSDFPIVLNNKRPLCQDPPHKPMEKYLTNQSQFDICGIREKTSLKCVLLYCPTARSRRTLIKLSHSLITRYGLPLRDNADLKL